MRLLKVDTLLVRREKADLVLVYKILHGLVDGLGQVAKPINVVELDGNRNTRGHSYKLRHKPFRINSRKKFFAVRVSRQWNLLPDGVVNSSSLSQFKRALNDVNFDHLNAPYFN